jgi:hypothetical protein
MTSPSSSRSPDHDPHRTIYYLGYPLGRFAGLKHRQLARQVEVIITTGRIRRTLVNKINLLVNSPYPLKQVALLLSKRNQFSYAASPVASARRAARRRLLHLRRASGCFGMSRDSSSTTSPRAGSSSTTSPTPRVRCLGGAARHAAHRRLLRLSQARCRLLRLRRASGCLGTPCGSSRGSSSTILPTPGVWVPRHVTRHVARLVVDYFTYARASGCFGTSRGLLRDSSSTSSPRAGSSSTTLPTPRVRVPLHVARSSRGSSSTTSPHAGSSSTTSATPRVRVHAARCQYFASRRLVVDYFAYATRPGASTCRAARHAARPRLLRLSRTSSCLDTSRGSSPGSSSTSSPTPRVRLLRHVARLVA